MKERQGEKTHSKEEQLIKIHKLNEELKKMSWMAHGLLVPFQRSPILFLGIWGVDLLVMTSRLTYGQ